MPVGQCGCLVLRCYSVEHKGLPAALGGPVMLVVASWLATAESLEQALLLISGIPASCHLRLRVL